MVVAAASVPCAATATMQSQVQPQVQPRVWSTTYGGKDLIITCSTIQLLYKTSR
jgi:hypothetical protein